MSFMYILPRPCQAVLSLPGGMVLGGDSHAASDKIETKMSERTWPESVNKLVIATQSSQTSTARKAAPN